MRAILFGATGMVGQGVLRECLLDPGVGEVLVIGRRAIGTHDEKLREIVLPDIANLSRIAGELDRFDACFFCLGVSSAGMSEAAYRRVTFDLTLAVAETLVQRNPGMTFVYVSGAGTDSTAKGRTMWARVKGETENALLALPFKEAVMFRPGLIVPLHGIRSKTFWYRAFYSAIRPLWPILRPLLPTLVTTTEQVGRAMIRVARDGPPKSTLETRDINAL